MGKVYKKVFTNYGLPENLRGRSDKSNILQIQRNVLKIIVKLLYTDTCYTLHKIQD